MYPNSRMGLTNLIRIDNVISVYSSLITLLVLIFGLAFCAKKKYTRESLSSSKKPTLPPVDMRPLEHTEVVNECTLMRDSSSLSKIATEDSERVRPLETCEDTERRPPTQECNTQAFSPDAQVKKGSKDNSKEKVNEVTCGPLKEEIARIRREEAEKEGCRETEEMEREETRQRHRSGGSKKEKRKKESKESKEEDPDDEKDQKEKEKEKEREKREREKREREKKKKKKPKKEKNDTLEDVQSEWGPVVTREPEAPNNKKKAKAAEKTKTSKAKKSDKNLDTLEDTPSEWGPVMQPESDDKKKKKKKK